MGGAGFLIYGHLKEENFVPGPIKRSFFQRLFGKEIPKSIETLDLGEGNQIMALDSRELKPLKKDFINFIKEEIKTPWEATRSVLSYLKLNVMSVDVRGKKESEKPETDWYVQVHFSGCSGMAEVSAALASHWVEIWVNKHFDRLKREYLEPYGFYPQKEKFVAAGEKENLIFFPLTQFGYALYHGQTRDIPPADDFEGPKYFELDGSIDETFADEPESLKAIDSFAPMMKNGKCRCQFCMPGFDLSLIAQLPY
jgi:hypothetical protein